MTDVVCALILRGDAVLLALRQPGKQMPACWEFPGGKVDGSETAEAALHRELMEELGCEVQVLHALPSSVHHYPWACIRLLPFISELRADSPEPVAKEHQALKWALQKDVLGHDLAPADVPVWQSFLSWQLYGPSSVALLAGGRSRRMGQDKAKLRWQGVELWQHQSQTLRRLHLPLLLSARREQGIFPDEATLIPDPEGEDCGPMPAIIRCLQHSAQRCLILAVDMPYMQAAMLQRLLTFPDSAVPRVNGQLQPLCAVYGKAMLPLLLHAQAAGDYSLTKVWLQAMQAGLAQVLEVKAEDCALFANWNEPQDLPLQAEQTVTLRRLATRTEASLLQDQIAVEEPLEIRVEGRSLAVVMRTPGHDAELAAGFLVSEGVVTRPKDVLEVSQCARTTESQGNVVDVLLGGVEMDWERLTRHVFSASSCGLCGKTSLDSVFQRFPAVAQEWAISAELLWSLPEKLRAAQQTFSSTGGLHACALFSQAGELQLLREDVGRHNALDKLLGHGALHGLLPYDQAVLLLSGRVSFEMMQKALAAGIAVVAAISAPTSLAVQFATESGQTLVGFLRPGRMNVYAGAQRIIEQC